MRRRLNKHCGLPSTPEVGTIAALLNQLRITIDDKLGPGCCKKALPAIPSLPGLSEEDLYDAMEYAGLVMLSTHKHTTSVASETSASFAGMGYGLCGHYDNVDACDNEEADMPVSHILALSLSNASFSATYTYMRTAYRSLIEKEAIRFDLGLDHLQDSEYEGSLYLATHS
jgi:hypothetical protein